MSTDDLPMTSGDTPVPAGDTTEAGTVHIRLTTTEPTASLPPLPSENADIFVPLDTKRYSLSRILNSSSMLNLPAPGIPLDFLITLSSPTDDETETIFLRSTLGEFLTERGLPPGETTVELTYVRALVPPVFDRSFEHDDWVSSVSVLTSAKTFGDTTNTRILTSSFDGLLRIFSPTTGACIATSPGPEYGGHSMPVKSAAFITPTLVASAGMDRVVKTWKYHETDSGMDVDEGESSRTGTFKPHLNLLGHTAPLTTLSVNGTKILTSDSAGNTALWSSIKEAAPAYCAPASTSISAAKRRKTSSSVTVPMKGALHLSKHHTSSSVSCFSALDSTVAYTGGATDHLLHTLDLPSFRPVTTIPLSADVTAILSLSGTLAPLVAAGTSARRIFLVDPRENSSGGRTTVMTLKGHQNWISSLSQSPVNDYAIASASHDGSVMVWDIRRGGASSDPTSSVPFRAASTNRVDGGREGGVLSPSYVIERESLKADGRGGRRPLAGDGVKVFGLCWDGEVGIVSGGEDKRVQVDRWDG